MLTIIKQTTLYVVMPSLILKKNLKAFKFQDSTNIRDFKYRDFLFSRKHVFLSTFSVLFEPLLKLQFFTGLFLLFLLFSSRPKLLKQRDILLQLTLHHFPFSFRSPSWLFSKFYAETVATDTRARTLEKPLEPIKRCRLAKAFF